MSVDPAPGQAGDPPPLDVPPADGSGDRQKRLAWGIGAGIAIGAGIGAALSAATGQSSWLAVGIGVGIALGAGLGAANRRG